MRQLGSQHLFSLLSLSRRAFFLFESFAETKNCTSELRAKTVLGQNPGTRSSSLETLDGEATPRAVIHPTRLKTPQKTFANRVCRSYGERVRTSKRRV